MGRFEEVQSIMVEVLREHFSIHSVQVFIEQFTLDRECKIHMSLPARYDAVPLLATVTVGFDVFQTSMGLYEDEIADEDEESIFEEVDRGLDIDVSITLPILKGDIDMLAVINEVELEYPDYEPELVLKRTLNAEDSADQYEVFIYYDVPADAIVEQGYYGEFFKELREIMELIYERIKNHIDYSWYKGND